MIEVVYERAPDALTVRVSGHAQCVRGQPNIVCAGVSALVGTLAEYVRMAAREGLCTADIRYLAGGSVVRAECPGGRGETLTAVVDALCMGLDMMALEYGNHVRYEVVEQG